MRSACKACARHCSASEGFGNICRFFARQSLVTRTHAPDVVGVDVFAEGEEDGVADAEGGTVGDRKGRRLGRDRTLHKRNLRYTYEE